jgi:hypothetical protein
MVDFDTPARRATSFSVTVTLIAFERICRKFDRRPGRHPRIPVLDRDHAVVAARVAPSKARATRSGGRLTPTATKRQGAAPIDW